MIVLLCFWSNQAKLANFTLFVLAPFYFSGRAFDIAAIPFRCIVRIIPRR